MAIKISGTTVITADTTAGDSKAVFENITGASGSYDNLRAFMAVTDSQTLDFNESSCSEIMSANETYTEANKSSGRVLFFWLTTNPSGTAYTPTFSANIKWPNNTEPTWADYNNWLICLVCWDSTIVRATASGFGGTITETITLSGTSSSYTSIGTEAQGADAVAGWRFNSNGTLFRTNFSGNYGVYNFLTEWCNTTPSQTYYLRCTVQAGSLGGNSASANVWLALTSDRTFEVVDTTAGTSPVNVQMKIEIADDSGGSNIVATGYYQAIANQEP